MKTYTFEQSIVERYTIKANTKEEAIKLYEWEAGYSIKPDSTDYIDNSTFIYDEDGNELSYWDKEE